MQWTLEKLYVYIAQAIPRLQEGKDEAGFSSKTLLSEHSPRLSPLGTSVISPSAQRSCGICPESHSSNVMG